MALPPSTANWHWKNKNVTRWGREWFERELPSISVPGDSDGEVVSVLRVTDVDGDVELGQRKSKLITIYDCKITLDWSGTTSDGTTVEGKLTIPEYEWSLSTASSPTVNAIFELAKKRLSVALETKFSEFPGAIIETHGKDLTASADPSRTGTPTPSAQPAAKATVTASAPTPAPKPKNEPKKALSTSTVTVEANLVASAGDLFGLLTDPSRLPAWTRAEAKSDPKVGGDFALFGGGVFGKYVSVTPGKEIVQSWALRSPTWPSEHAATLTTTLDQGSDSTKVIFALSGVPTGMEDEITKNLQAYYINGFKSIGLATDL
ncbi:hypothetical protein ONZ45_g1051 [Pleurotus djamor]|nr:hypothetical protein ONZ45_g1051 [Pleurotus djamor]